MREVPGTNFPPSRPVVDTRDEDAMIVATILAGNEDAFAVLVRRYTRPLWNVAYRITGSREDAADATQNAFVRCFQGLGHFDPQRRFFSWLYRIGVNAALDVVAGRRGEEVRVEDAEPMLRADRGGEAREISLAVQEAIGLLSPEHRAVIVLRHYSGLSYEEMAEVLGVDVGLVRSRLFAARRRLQEMLGPARMVTS